MQMPDWGRRRPSLCCGSPARRSCCDEPEPPAFWSEEVDPHPARLMSSAAGQAAVAGTGVGEGCARRLGPALQRQSPEAPADQVPMVAVWRLDARVKARSNARIRLADGAD